MIPHRHYERTMIFRLFRGPTRPRRIVPNKTHKGVIDQGETVDTYGERPKNLFYFYFFFGKTDFL